MEGKDFLMRTHGLFHWTIRIAASMICILVMIAPVSAKSKVKDQTVMAVSGTVTGDVQEVGLRAMIQKQAILYNLAGSVENNADGSVRFTLQGDNDRIKQALKTISKGTKKSSNVNVSTSSAAVSQTLKTVTVVGWTSVSRGITHPYDLVFPLRNPDTVIKNREVKAIWLKICETAVIGEDTGKCDKDDDD
jgi:acylphosphatase